MGEVTVKAIDGIDLEIEENKVISLMGKSGSGKSTLLHQIGLLDRPTSGKVIIDGVDVTHEKDTKRSKKRLELIGYVFQEYALLPELTALENVYLPGMMLDPKSDYKNRAIRLLEQVGLGKRYKHLPKELSGGEQQRVAIARALINEPNYVLADEPTANLDSISSENIMETLLKMNKEIGVTILFVSHDPDDKKYATQHIYLKDGKLVEPYF
ncbi:MAG: ABC transporter ATP-binding protein [Candidatus Dojkabacteria bacterium]|nr:ABC transporter ATP-binding protein [Candidatus Dojkabacteria bacterium]